MSKKSRLLPLVPRLRRHRDERGAYAILFSMMLVLVIALAAIAVDIASQVSSKQQLKDTMDTAAHAAAFELPDNAGTAAATATAMARANDATANPVTDLWCVVASTGVAEVVNTDQIPSTCNPGSPPYTAGNYPGLVCDEVLCFIPCRASATTKCNTIRVADEKTVPYAFAPAIGFAEGSTGAVVSVACKGSCGTETPNPLDIVIMADRTPSMATTDRQEMVSGIRTMLTTMDPTMHYVAFGALHKSRKPGEPDYSSSCIAQNTLAPNNDYYNESLSKVGTWIPVPFSNDYLTSTKAFNTTSTMAKALTCVSSGTPDGKFGTHLASAMKAAGRYALGWDSNNLSSLPSTRPGIVRKVVVFETDGSPDETFSNGSANLNVAGDVASRTKQTACDNFEKVATQFKNEPNTILITIGFGGANTLTCSSNKPVRDLLARAASPSPLTGAPSKALDCTSSANKTKVNTDGDFYFCATSGTEMANVFKTAFSQLDSGIRLLKMPT